MLLECIPLFSRPVRVELTWCCSGTWPTKQTDWMVVLLLLRQESVAGLTRSYLFLRQHSLCFPERTEKIHQCGVSKARYLRGLEAKPGPSGWSKATCTAHLNPRLNRVDRLTCIVSRHCLYKVCPWAVWVEKTYPYGLKAVPKVPGGEPYGWRHPPIRPHGHARERTNRPWIAHSLGPWLQNTQDSGAGPHGSIRPAVWEGGLVGLRILARNTRVRISGHHQPHIRQGKTHGLQRGPRTGEFHDLSPWNYGLSTALNNTGSPWNLSHTPSFPLIPVRHNWSCKVKSSETIKLAPGTHRP